MIPMLVLSILIDQAPLPGGPVDVWVKCHYNGSHNTWGVRLIPTTTLDGPVWFGGGVTNYTTGKKDCWFLVSSFEPSAIFRAEIVEEKE